MVSLPGSRHHGWGGVGLGQISHTHSQSRLPLPALQPMVIPMQGADEECNPTSASISRNEPMLPELRRCLHKARILFHFYMLFNYRFSYEVFFLLASEKWTVILLLCNLFPLPSIPSQDSHGHWSHSFVGSRIRGIQFALPSTPHIYLLPTFALDKNLGG